MKIKILHTTPLINCSNAIRQCYNSFKLSDNGGEKDIKLIDRVGNQYNHSSVLEHIVIQMRIEGISRALLQQLARHRHISMSVESTRYTLGRFKNIDYLRTLEELSAYCVITGYEHIDRVNLRTLNSVIEMKKKGYSNDNVKYCLPEAFKTNLHITLNLRELQHIVRLRGSKHAMLEFRILIDKIKEAMQQHDINIYNLIKGGEKNVK